MKWYWWLLGGTVVAVLINRQRVIHNLKNMQLSKNFSLDEFVITGTGIENVPGEGEISNLQALVQSILQPLRDYLGKPIIITSGYRSPLVNSAIGGSKTSQHVNGEASDFHVEGLTNQQIIDAIRRLNLPYDQVIDEQLKGRKWVHVSHKQSGNRKQWLTARDGQNGSTVYNTVQYG